MGHADLFDTAEGGTAMVLLGVRPVGLALAFSPLGRETFVTNVEWVDEWPHVQLPQLAGRRAEEKSYDFTSAAGIDELEWIAVRHSPAALAVPSPEGLVLTGQGGTMDAPEPVFVGQRQRHLAAEISGVLDVSAGDGGLAVRNAEDNWFGIEARGDGDVVAITARATVASLTHTWAATLPKGDVVLSIRMTPPPPGFGSGAVGGDRIQLLAGAADGDLMLLAELDGRHWAFETAKAFTGRVFGVVAIEGRIVVRRIDYSGTD
jgi:hypothetical protein